MREKSRLALAARAGREGNYRKAVNILSALIAGSEAPPEAWLLLGRSFHALGDYSRALAAFNDYLRIKPASAQGYFFIGRAYLSLGLPYKAAPYLRKALDYSPGNPLCMAFLGLAYLKSRHSGRALAALEEAVESAAARNLPPEDQKRIYRAYLNSLLLRGITLCRREDYDLGLQMLRFVLAAGNDGALLRLEMGRACREMGLPEEALEHYGAALNFAPEDKRIRWYRASLLMAMERDAEAREEIERIRRSGEGDSVVPDLPWNSELVDFFMIRSFLAAGEWRRAADACKKRLKRREAASRSGQKPPPGERPGVIHALYAEALRNMGDFKAAHNHILRALEEEPGEVEFWYEDLLNAWECRNWKLMEKALKGIRSLGGDPDMAGRFEALLDAHLTKDDKKRLALLQNAVRRLGPEPELMYALGEAYLAVGLLEEALAWFRKTRAFRPGHEASALGEITALEALLAEGGGRWEEALKTAYGDYLAAWPLNVNIRRERALFLIKTGDYKEAAGELEEILVQEPANMSLRRALAYAYRKTGRYREAAVFLKALLKEQPANVELLLEFSGCLERAGSDDYAILVLEKARTFLEHAGEIPLALGLIWYRRRNLEKAFDFLREAAAKSPKDPRPYDWMAEIVRRRGGSGEQAARYEYESRRRRGPGVEKNRKN